MGAPAATLRRLQDGGSPDNSGAAGKGLFTDLLYSYPCHVCCVHMSPLVASPTGDFFAEVIVPVNGVFQ